MRNFLRNSGRVILAFTFFISYLPAHAATASSEAVPQLVELQNQLQTAMSLPVSSHVYNQIRDNATAFEKKHASALKNDANLNFEFNKLKRLAIVQDNFHHCLKRFDDNSGLGRRILNLAYGLNADQLDCTQISTPTTGGQIDALSEMAKKAVHEQMKTKMSSQIRMNAATNLADINYRLKDENLQTTQQILDTICPGKVCSSNEKAKVLSAVEKHINKLRESGVVSVTAAQAAESMNSSVRDINSIILEPFKAKNKAKQDEKGRQMYGRYSEAFWRASSEGIGLLMHSDAVRGKVGDYEAYNGVERGRKTFLYSLDVKTLKAAVDDKTISKAKAEYSAEMKDMSRDLSKGMDLKEMIRHYPLAAAQMLVHDPSFSREMCDLIEEVEKEEASSRRKSTVRRWALAGAGTLLMAGGALVSLTGVGSVVGVPAASMGAAIAAAGAGVTALELGASTYDYISARSEVEFIVRSSMTGSGDRQSREIEAAERENVGDALFGMAATAGLSGGGVALAKLLNRTKKVAQATGGTQPLSERVSSTADLVHSEKSLKNALSQMDESERLEFLGDFAGLPNKERNLVLDTLRKAEANGGSADDYLAAKRSIDEALAGCK